MRRLHLVVGTLALIAFVLQGQYMHWVLAHLAGVPDGPRLLYRSAHIYLLFAALLNLLLAAHFRPALGVAARRMQGAGSVVLLVTPALFLAAFFVEPGLMALERPWAGLGIFGSLGAVLLHVIAHRGASETPTVAEPTLRPAAETTAPVGVTAAAVRATDADRAKFD